MQMGGGEGSTTKNSTGGETVRSREKTTIKMGRSAKRNVRKDKGDEKWRGTAVPTGSNVAVQQLVSLTPLRELRGRTSFDYPQKSV